MKDAEGKLRFLRDLFREEAQEGLQQLNTDMVAWEQASEGGALLERLHRTTHNLKGAAASVDLSVIRDLCHACETAFRRLEQLEPDQARPDIGAIYHAFDALEREIDKLPDGTTDIEPQLLAIFADLEALAVGGDAAPPVWEAAPPVPTADGTSVAAADVTPVAAHTAPPVDRPAPDGTSDLAQAPAPQIEVAPAETVIAPSPAPTPVVAAPIVPVAAPSAPVAAAPVAPKVSGSAAAAPQRAAERDETIRVSVEKLDRLMGQIGQIDLTQTHSELRVGKLQALWLEVERQRKEMDLVRDEIRRFAREADVMRYPRLLEFHKEVVQMMRSLHEQVGSLAHEASSDHRSLEILGVHLREDINRLRMRPVASILEATPREVRDLASRFGKEVELVIQGGEVEVDKHVLEALRAPVMHMVRNALDHGLEMPADRINAGKPARGRLVVSCAQIGSQIRVEVSDDGRGFVVEKIARAAIEKGLVTAADVGQMSQDSLRRLILRPGFSTAAEVTDVSGRGVGLDVVASSVIELGGSVELGGQEHKGARVAIMLPLTMATSQALFLEAGEHTYALPTAAIERVAKTRENQLLQMGSHQVVMIGDDPIDVARLTDLIKMPAKTGQASGDDADLSLVVLGLEDRRLAIIVDELLEARQIVVKQLGDQLKRVTGVSGATIDGTGRVIPILNPFDLLHAALSGVRSVSQVKAPTVSLQSEPAAAQRRESILVVDDSATVREMERTILEAAGYQVVLAKSGEEAVSTFSSLDCPMAFFDLDMPGIGGFEAIRQIRELPGGAQLRVVIVSSRTDEASLQRAKELGVIAFITKSEFEPATFLRLVAQNA